MMRVVVGVWWFLESLRNIENFKRDAIVEEE